MNYLKDIKKDYIISFIVGALLFGGIGVVLATSIASSSIDYVTQSNENVATVKDALDDLYNQIIGYPIECYNGVCGKLSYRYWTDEYSDVDYLYNSLPEESYESLILLEQAANFMTGYSTPYIRSTLIDGNVVGHQICQVVIEENSETGDPIYPGNEFCIGYGYWVGELNVSSQSAADQTAIKFQRDYYNARGVNISSSCREFATYIECNDYKIENLGSVQLGTTYICSINSDKSANCYIYTQQEI